MGGTAGLLVLLTCYISLSVGYSTSGTNIIGPNGDTILLRGIDRPSLEWDDEGQYLSLSDYTLMANWGANIIRLSLSQCFWNSDSDGYQSTVADQVAWIKSLGMGVILDLHWSVGSGSTCDQQTMPDSGSTTFWTSVATAYANDPWVIFELYNEPNSVSWAVWRNGGNAGGFTTPGFQELYNTVRDTGANNVVLIGGLDWAYDLSGVAADPISGTNIVYNTHPYNDPGKLLANWPANFTGVLGTFPLIATEFGDTTGDCDTTYYSEWISYADANCISWTAFGWWVESCTFPSLISDWNGDPSSNSGTVVQASLLQGHQCGSSSAPTTAATTSATSATSTTSTSKAPTTTTSTTSTSTTTTGSSTTPLDTVYADALGSNWQDWSWATHSLTNTNPAIGAYSISFTLGSYTALYFDRNSAFELSSYHNLVFSVNGGSLSGIPLQVILYSSSDEISASAVQVSGVEAGTWVTETIAVSSFPGVTETTQLSGFVIQVASSTDTGTIYIDNIFFD